MLVCNTLHGTTTTEKHTHTNDSKEMTDDTKIDTHPPPASGADADADADDGGSERSTGKKKRGGAAAKAKGQLAKTGKAAAAAKAKASGKGKGALSVVRQRRDWRDMSVDETAAEISAPAIRRLGHSANVACVAGTAIGPARQFIKLYMRAVTRVAIQNATHANRKVVNEDDIDAGLRAVRAFTV